VSVVARRWVVGAFVALLAAWLVAPSVLPIYDGLSNPDEPYRFVKPPANAKTTKQPTPATASIPVVNGLSRAAYVNSKESGPQISLYLPAGAIRAPGAATTVLVNAQPLAPQPPLPSKGTIVSNVYRITATAGGAAASVVGTGNQEPTLQMRSPSQGRPGLFFMHRTSTGWVQVATTRVGFDIYQAQAAAFGDWALVQVGSTAPGSKSGGGGVNVVLLALGIAVLALAGIILLVRTLRQRQAVA